MRVTWTELARRNTKFGRELSSATGKRQKEVDQEILARQREANQKYEEDSDEEDEEQAFIPTPGDKDGPTEIKTNFNRRKTMLRKQLIESESHEMLLRPGALSSENDPSSGLGAVEDTQEGEDEEDADIFDAFKFTSFKTKLAIDERYDMVHLKDPEEPELIETQLVFPKEKVEKNSVELVAINADALAKQEKLK